MNVRTLGGMSKMTQGSTITLLDGQLQVPKNPIIHYIEGDGIGIDITPVMLSLIHI